MQDLSKVIKKYRYLAAYGFDKPTRERVLKSEITGLIDEHP